MRFSAFLGAAFIAAIIGIAPAQASSTFDYKLVPTPGEGTDTGIGDFALSVNPTAFGNATNLAAYETAFSFTVDGNTFNLSDQINGTKLTIEFIAGALYDITWSGSYIDKAGDRITLDFNGTSYVYYDQSNKGTTVTYGSLDTAPAAAVPEPSSALPMVPGLVLLGSFAMRRRAKQATAATA
jgi:hypothetical protein